MLVAKSLPIGKTLTMLGVVIVALGTILYLVYTNFISTSAPVSDAPEATGPSTIEISAAEAKFKLPSGQVLDAKFFDLPAVTELFNFGDLPVMATPVKRDNPFAPLSSTSSRR
ncbi:MAG: hypothetical protein AAB657_00450 [Patescibacteria group bacterium]